MLRSRKLSVPVVSVGNLTTGGTGKTPLVVWIARWLAGRGVATAILSRGYGSTAPDGSDTDEALLFRRFVPHVPHLTGSDRYASGQRAIADHGAQCLVLDDGFQHRQLARDLNIAVVDCLLPFGYGHLLPRGLLREPLGSLRRADLIVLSRYSGSDTWFVSMAEIDATGLVGGMVTDEIKVWGWSSDSDPGAPSQLYDGAVGGTLPTWDAADPDPLIVMTTRDSGDVWWLSMAEVSETGAVSGMLTDRMRVHGW